MEDRGEAETIQFANSLCYKDTDSQSMLQGHRLTVYATRTQTHSLCYGRGSERKPLVILKLSKL